MEEEKKESENNLDQHGPTKEAKDKYNALIAGVVFFMLLIGVLWVMNLHTIISGTAQKKSDDIDIDKISQELEKALNQTGEKISDLKNIDTSDLQKYAASVATSSAK
jgi:hypothetical protein